MLMAVKACTCYSLVNGEFQTFSTVHVNKKLKNVNNENFLNGSQFPLASIALAVTPVGGGSYGSHAIM